MMILQVSQTNCHICTYNDSFFLMNIHRIDPFITTKAFHLNLWRKHTEILNYKASIQWCGMSFCLLPLCYAPCISLLNHEAAFCQRFPLSTWEDLLDTCCLLFQISQVIWVSKLSLISSPLCLIQGTPSLLILAPLWCLMLCTLLAAKRVNTI